MTSTVDFSRVGLSITASLPHLLHVILHSAPTRVRVHSEHPQGCFFFILTTSPTSYLYKKNFPGMNLSPLFCTECHAVVSAEVLEHFNIVKPLCHKGLRD